MPAKGSWLKAFLTHNPRIKALSLILAVISWYAIRDAISFEVVIRDIRVDPQVKEGMAILNQSANTVDVTFRGSQEDIRLIDPRQIRAVVDLRSASAGAEHVSLGPGNIEGTRGVRAVAVKPGKLWVTLDRESGKMVTVRGMTVNKPLLGQVESITCTPARVKIWGPARKLETTEVVYTMPVDVDGRIEPFVKRIPVLPPSDTWVARIEPPEVQVRVNIVEKSAEREWHDIPVAAAVTPGLSPMVEVRPPKVRVVLSGRSEALQSVRDTEVKVLADCVGLAVPGEYDVPAMVRLPTELDLSSVTDPETVHVVLTQPE